MRHCDEYIDDETTPDCLRNFLDYARSPAHGAMLGQRKPICYADFEGETVKLNMASRFGDVGISKNLKSEYGYFKRVFVSDLSNFRPQPNKADTGGE